MSVACGIVGLPFVGKTTLFRAATGWAADHAGLTGGALDPHLAEVDVPDERLAVLNRFVETKKLVPAKTKLVDVPGLADGASQGEGRGNKFLGHLKEADALMHVVRCFEAGEEGIEPARDVETFELELAAADFETCARNVDRVSKKARSGDRESLFQKELFERARDLLEEGTQLRFHEWKPQELDALRPLFLLSLKPVLFVANVDQEDLAGEGKAPMALAAFAENRGEVCIPICADIECELSSMEDDDRSLFMEEFGVTELVLPRLLQATYGLLGLQTFFTAGEKEIKAWTITRGDTAPVAAGKIHSDFEKGFVRSETYSVEDLVEYATEAAIKQAGKMRIEGRDYVMQEGDVCHFLVNR
jgi:GTP-binding protein YchF